MLKRPSSCTGCSLNNKATGYAPAVGPEDSPLLFVGEALGTVEATKGVPFVGPSGELLNRVLKKLGLDRESVRIDNCVRCQPPKDWLVGAPWERHALSCCNQYISSTLSEPHKVVVALGATATKQLLNISKTDYKADYFHGTPVQRGHLTIIPTYHPSYLLRGNHKLSGVFMWDLQKAKEIAYSGVPFQKKKTNLIVDPPIQWFTDWTKAYLERKDAVWLAVDIETHGKLPDEGELEYGVDVSILRINFSDDLEMGITVPWAAPYLAIIRELLNANGTKVFWNRRFDLGVLRSAGIPINGSCLDVMDMWHVLQSDLPRSLGFVAPFYSDYGPWKHLSGANPGLYAAIDAVQTIRCAYGIAVHLKDNGGWDAYFRHCHKLDDIVLFPAERIGVKVDKERLDIFKEGLIENKAITLEAINHAVPESVQPLIPKAGWKRPPGEMEGIITRLERQLVNVCLTCDATQITKKHRCSKKKGTPIVELIEAEVPRYYRREDFNPGSPLQVLDLIKSLKESPGRVSKKTGAATTDQNTLNRLAKKHKVFRDILNYREIDKALGTYALGAEKRLAADGRLHPKFLHRPSTMRLSCVDPNLQNVISDRGGSDSIAAGFRLCLVAADGCSFVEGDYSAIEAVETGWFADDTDYMRLAQLGVHAYVAAHLLGRPASLAWSDADLRECFSEIKKKSKDEYDLAKRCVHGTNYGLTPYGMVNNYPEVFTLASAKRLQQIYFDLCPKLVIWHKSVRDRAYRQGYLGGTDHPYGYRHYFHNVYVWDSRIGSLKLGEDGKRCIAYEPQSTSFGVLADACLRLMDSNNSYYIGDMYYGKTPIRALIHDSILLEVPDKDVEEAKDRLMRGMSVPISAQGGLKIGVEVKIGKNWGEMT